MHVRAQVEEECGHSGWYQEGGFIASCTDAADCAKDNSKSTLNPKGSSKLLAQDEESVP